MKPPSNHLVRLSLLLLSFSSIAALLTHLPGWISMHTWAVRIYPAVAVAIAALWLTCRSRGDADTLQRLRAGMVGGLLGTIGYDLVRVPFYYGGFNLMHAIRSYGMWLCGAEQSTFVTDAAGLAYHLSNGITFGWIYSLLLIRRHWVWGLVWGLLLEGLAMLTTFGAVFGMDRLTFPVLVAFGAHIFYGVPLGWACQHPDRTDRLYFPFLRRPPALAATAVFLAFGYWLLMIQAAGWGGVARHTVVCGPERVVPVWSDAQAGSVFSLQNATDRTLEIAIRVPARPAGPFRNLTLKPGATEEFLLDDPGLYQIQALNTRWRSVTLAVSRNGDYRPPHPR